MDDEILLGGFISENVPLIIRHQPWTKDTVI